MTFLTSELPTAFLSSVFTVAFLWILKALWDRWMQDIWLKLVSRHVLSVAGQWTGETAHTNFTTSEILILRQSGWKLKGTFEYKTTEKGVSQIKLFELEGILRADILCLYYWNKDRSARGAGSMTMRIIGDGDTLEGYISLYESISGDLACTDVEYHRAGNGNI